MSQTLSSVAVVTGALRVNSQNFRGSSHSECNSIKSYTMGGNVQYPCSYKTGDPLLNYPKYNNDSGLIQLLDSSVRHVSHFIGFWYLSHINHETCILRYLVGLGPHIRSETLSLSQFCVCKQ